MVTVSLYRTPTAETALSGRRRMAATMWRLSTSHLLTTPKTSLPTSPLLHLRTRPCLVPLSLDKGRSIPVLHPPCTRYRALRPPFVPSRPSHLTSFLIVTWVYSRACRSGATRAAFVAVKRIWHGWRRRSESAPRDFEIMNALFPVGTIGRR